jgi:hypothetical protein
MSRTRRTGPGLCQVAYLRSLRAGMALEDAVIGTEIWAGFSYSHVDADQGLSGNLASSGRDAWGESVVRACSPDA